MHEHIPIFRYFGTLSPLFLATAEKMSYDHADSPVARGSSILSHVYNFLLAENWTDGSLLSLKQDIVSGLTLAVTQVAPSIGFALIAGGPPLYGLFSSFFLGVFSCILGGRPGQITAIAGAVVVLYPPLVEKHGYDAICVVSLFTGLLLLVLGLLRVSKYVTLLPATLMVGFCCGLCVSMILHQIDSFRNQDGRYPVGTDALYVSILVIFTYCVMMLLPLFTTVLPSTFVAIILGTALNYAFQMQTSTIGDLYVLKGDFPPPKIPDVNWSSRELWKDVVQSSFLTFVITSIESFMSGYKIQQMTETSTNFDREALGLGAAFIINGFFQGMPGCVVFGPSVLNIDNGTGTRRLAGLICATLMAIFPLALYPVIRYLPMAVLSGVVFGVSSKTADWRMFAMIFLQRISFQEAIVALAVTVTTAVTNLALATGVGFAVALLFFMWNMSRGRLFLKPQDAQDEDHWKEEIVLSTSKTAPRFSSELYHRSFCLSGGGDEELRMWNTFGLRECEIEEDALKGTGEFCPHKLQGNSIDTCFPSVEEVIEATRTPDHFPEELGLHHSACNFSRPLLCDFAHTATILSDERETTDKESYRSKRQRVSSSFDFRMKERVSTNEHEKKKWESSIAQKAESSRCFSCQPQRAEIVSSLPEEHPPSAPLSSSHVSLLPINEEEFLATLERNETHEMLREDLREKSVSAASGCDEGMSKSEPLNSFSSKEGTLGGEGSSCAILNTTEDLYDDHGNEGIPSVKEIDKSEIDSNGGEIRRNDAKGHCCLLEKHQEEEKNNMEGPRSLKPEGVWRSTSGRGGDELPEEEQWVPENTLCAVECHFSGKDEMPYTTLPAEVSPSFDHDYHSGFVVPNSSMTLQNFHLDIQLLHIEVDPTFPQVKVLRVKLFGVLFFGSCTEFVEKMMKIVHVYHAYLFLCVTDIIFDFQDGLMPVIDYSGGEALEAAAATLAKRGIRVHVQHLDPLSEQCIERARRYFPHLSEDNINNVKYLCYTRRIFKRGFFERVEVSPFSNQEGTMNDLLEEDVFLRPNTSVGDEPRSPDTLTSVLTSLSFLETIKIGFPLYLKNFGITVPVFETLQQWEEMTRSRSMGLRGVQESVDAAAHPLVFPRLEELTLGITDTPPFDRRFGEFGHVWLDRLRGKDLRKQSPRVAFERRFVESAPVLAVGNPRPPPESFIQVPRFPGQGFAKNEKFSRAEQTLIQKAVLNLWGIEDDPYPPPHCFHVHLLNAVNQYIDGIL